MYVLETSIQLKGVRLAAVRHVSELRKVSMSGYTKGRKAGKSHDATMTYTPAWHGASPGSRPHSYGTV